MQHEKMTAGEEQISLGVDVIWYNKRVPQFTPMMATVPAETAQLTADTSAENARESGHLEKLSTHFKSDRGGGVGSIMGGGKGDGTSVIELPSLETAPASSPSNPGRADSRSDS